MLVVTVLRDVARLVFDSPSLTEPTAMAVLGLAVLSTLIGYLNARRLASVLFVDIPLANLPKELAGFTIVQLSDIHVGPTIKREYVQAIVERVNQLDADLVVITGDVVDGSVEQLRAHTAPLGSLARQFFCDRQPRVLLRCCRLDARVRTYRTAWFA